MKSKRKGKDQVKVTVGKVVRALTLAGIVGHWVCAGAETTDAAKFGFSASATPSANADALQKALDGGDKTVVVSRPGVYELDRTVFMDSNTSLLCAKGVVFRKAARYAQVLANRGAFNYTTNCNIVISGLELRCGALDERQDENSNAPGLRGQIAFVRIRNVIVRDFVCTEYGLQGSNQYCLQFVGFDNVLVENFDIRGGKDGIHFDYGRNFVVRHGKLRTNDDGVAVNAGDWPGSVTPLIGSIENGIVEDIDDLPGGTCNFARCITGVWQDWHPGIRLQRNDLVRVGKNVYCVYPMPLCLDSAVVPEYVSNVAPTHGHGVWKSPEGICFQFMQDDGNLRADIRNVTFRNIRMNAARGISCSYEILHYARLLHPEIRRADYPVCQIRVEDVVKTAKGPIVNGNADADITMDRCRNENGPLIDMGRSKKTQCPVRRISVDGVTTVFTNGTALVDSCAR